MGVSLITIPTDTKLIFWTQTTTLDGIDYVLEFRYNTREATYYLSISLTDQTVLAQGIKLVSDFPLLQAYADIRMPPGELVAMAFGSNDANPAIGELGIGQRVELTYITESEMAELGMDGWRV